MKTHILIRKYAGQLAFYLISPKFIKYHDLFNKTCNPQLTVENVPIASSSCEKLLGIKIDQKLSFEPHFESPCKNLSQKLNALSWMASSLKFEQKTLLLNFFITAQFS